MAQLTSEQRLKHFQLALSMVGISANLMSCELIHSISAAVDEKQGSFTLDDATHLAETIQAKYMPQPPQHPGNNNIPDQLKKMMAEGKLHMEPIPPSKQEEIITPEVVK